MKKITCLVLSFCCIGFSFAKVNVTLSGAQAKHIYNNLKGPNVKEDGTTGHFYRLGKDVVCRYTNADMDDNNGKMVPGEDARRYVCALKFDKNGKAYPRKNF